MSTLVSSSRHFLVEQFCLFPQHLNFGVIGLMHYEHLGNIAVLYKCFLAQTTPSWGQ